MTTNKNKSPYSQQLRVIFVRHAEKKKKEDLATYSDYKEYLASGYSPRTDLSVSFWHFGKNGMNIRQPERE